MESRATASVSVSHPGDASATHFEASTPRKCSARSGYIRVLTWAFTVFATIRVISYLPTLWAISAAGDSHQHSLWTWCTWLGANATMAAWLYECNGRRLDRSVFVNVANAVMCAATIVVIATYRV